METHIDIWWPDLAVWALFGAVALVYVVYRVVKLVTSIPFGSG
jgi:hypothetical protein